MPYITLSGGLPLVVPTDGSRGWGSTIKTNTFQAITDHDHTTGKGNPITAGAISANAVGGPAIRLANNVYLRGRNQAGSGDIDLIKVNTSDKLAFGANISAATIEGALTMSGLSASQFVVTDGSSVLESTALPTASWVPTISTSSGTNNGGSLQEARYVQIGSIVVFWVYFTSFTVLTGTPSTITITPPAAGVSMSGLFPVGLLTSNTTPESAYWSFNGTIISISQTDGGQFTNGGSAYVASIQGFYRAV